MSGLGAINFAGIGSGLDTKSIVAALVAAERMPLNRLEAKKTTMTTEQSTFSDIKTRVDALKTKGEDIDLAKTLLSYNATSSDEDVATITATGEALPGTFDLTVQNLATSQRNYSKQVSDDATAGLLGSGTLDITVGTDTTISVTVDSNTTLNSLASQINSSGARVSAGVLFDGSQYRLQITGDDAGAANSVVFGETGSVALDLNGTGVGSAGKQVEAAQDANFTLDGFAMTSTDNIIDDVIPGVTFTLNSATTQTERLTIAQDNDGITKKIKDMLNAFNSVIGRVNEELQLPADGKPQAGKLFGDSTLRTMQSQLTSTLTDPVPGLTGNYTALSLVGITTDSSGMLSMDEDDFKDALNDDLDAVMDLFVNNTEAGTTGVAQLIQDSAKNFTDFADGLLSIRIKGYDTSLRYLDDDIANQERNLSAFEDQMNKQFVSLEVKMIELQAQNQAVMSMMSFI